MNETFKSGLEKTTRSSVGTALHGPNGFATVSQALGDPNPLPAKFDSICYWLQWITVTLAFASAVTYLSSLRGVHNAQGLPYLTQPHERPNLRRFLAGLARKCPSSVVQEYTLITPLSLRLFLPALDLNLHDHRLFLFVSIIACYRAMRGGELLSPFSSDRNKQLYCKDWKLDPKTKGAILTLPFTKTSPANPVPVWFPSITQDNTCPVLAGTNFLSKSTAHLPTTSSNYGSQPLFLCADGKALTIDRMLEWTSKFLLASNQPETDPLSAKTWRRGTVTTLDRMPPSTIEAATKALGRWTSLAYLSYAQDGIARTVLALAAEGRDQHRHLKDSTDYDI